MNLELTYNEIQNYVKSKLHVEPIVESVDSKTLRITYKMNMFVPAVSVDLHVDSISNGTVVLSYRCSDIVNGLLKGIIGFVEDKIPSHQVGIFTDTKRVLVHLDAFEKLDKVLAVVEPTDISFNDKSAELKLLLKS